MYATLEHMIAPINHEWSKICQLRIDLPQKTENNLIQIAIQASTFVTESRFLLKKTCQLHNMYAS